MCSIHKKECLTIKLQNAWIYFSFLLKANATLEGGELHLHLQLANKSATKDAAILYISCFVLIKSAVKTTKDTAYDSKLQRIKL